MTLSRRATGVGSVGAAAIVAGGYWRHMSPSSQAVGAFPFSQPTAEGSPRIALTFDDGPNEPFTSQLAEVLAERKVAATFFQVGRCSLRHPGLTSALASAGHVIGNHSFSHAFTRGWSENAIHREVRLAEDVLSDELGRRPLLYRPPWLIRTRGLFRVLDDLGLQPVSGTFCHPLEPIQPRAERIAARAAARARRGGILIFHDGYDDRGGDRAATVAAVAMVIDVLSSRGFEFVTVDHLLGVPAYDDVRVPTPVSSG